MPTRNKNWMVFLGLMLATGILLFLWKTRREPAKVAPPEIQPIAVPSEAPIAPPPGKKAVPKPSPHVQKIQKPAPPPPRPVAVPPSPVLVPPSPVQVPPPPLPPVQELNEWRGKDTSITHEGQVVIHNDRQWVKFWSEHHPGEAAPEIDFTRDMVVGVFAGARPADPFEITILGTREVSKTLWVDYRETLPPTGTLAVGVTVYPYHLKVIPRTALPVKFKIFDPKR